MATLNKLLTKAAMFVIWCGVFYLGSVLYWLALVSR